jgi:hypothetical protein
MRLLIVFAVCVCSLTAIAATRSPDIPFAIHMIDGGASETAAVVDINRDGRLDIVSGENWYERAGTAQTWTKHAFRTLNYTSNYFDNFSDMPVDVNGDGYPDIVSVSWFAKRVAWWKNPGRGAGSAAESWTQADINTGFNVEFAILADLDNDGKAFEVLAQENGTPQSWYEVKAGAWIKHVAGDRSYGHGIGAGDVNGDGRNDILTPRGWLEAPADPRAANWTFHADWESINVPPAPAGAAAPAAAPTAAAAPRQMELGFMHVLDVNGDGRNDVITAAGHDYGVFWYEQRENGTWVRRTIDNAWSQGHASTLVDLNGDGRKDFVTGKRFMAHNGGDPGEKEPLGVYWYEYAPSTPAAAPRQPPDAAAAARTPGTQTTGEWLRHVVDYGGRMGGGMQIPVIDIDGDGDLDLVCAGKSGLFVVENTTKPVRR